MMSRCDASHRANDRRHVRRAMLGSVLLAAGCTAHGPSSDFFLLQAVAPLSEHAVPGPAVAAVGVGPVRFPRYLDRPQMVFALSGGQLRLRDDERWADNLRENFTRVFAEDLAAHVPVARVLLHPWSRTEPVDFKLTMRVNEFHVTDAGLALLDVRWDLYRKEGLVLSRKSRLSSPAATSSAAMGVAALSRTVDALSRDCAAAIRHAMSDAPARIEAAR